MAITKYYQERNLASRISSWGKAGVFYSFVPKVFFDALYFPFKIVFNAFSFLEVEGKENLENLSGPLIIASSHGSWIDPILIAVAFPFNSRVFPIHYATLWKYYYFPLFTPLIWLAGGFPVRKRIGLDKALAVPEEILELGGVVGIFPTGKRVRKWNENEAPRARRGAAYLAEKTGVAVLPVKIEGNIGMNFKSFLMKKYRIKLKFGKVFSLPPRAMHSPEDLNEPTDYIMERITRM